MHFYNKTTREVRGKFSLRGVGEVKIDGIDYGVCGLLGFDTDNPNQVRIVEYPETVYVESFQGTKRGTIQIDYDANDLYIFGNGQKMYLTMDSIARVLADYDATVATERSRADIVAATAYRVRLYDAVNLENMIPENERISRTSGEHSWVISQIVH